MKQALSHDPAADDFDVEFRVTEHPEDPYFPRIPNVVSRRGHKLKIIAIIRKLPAGASSVTLYAVALLVGPKRFGANAVFSPIDIWGAGTACDQDVPDDGFSHFEVEIIVSPPQESDFTHLGEGPDYQAFVSVQASGSSASGDEGQAGGDADAGGSQSDASPDFTIQSASTKTRTYSFPFNSM